MPSKKPIFKVLIWLVIFSVGVLAFKWHQEQKAYQKIIARLQADSRVAEVLVSAVQFDEASGKNLTTIKFVEYDTKGGSLPPKYFTFSGNLIQFQSLVVRFEDPFIKEGHRLKGKSVYLFWKAFVLDGQNTQEFPITIINEVPGGYKVGQRPNAHEDRFWKEFWRYAFDPQKAKEMGIKNVQIEAPGVMFVPGYLYTVKIEHDGGLRIDTKPLPAIVRGENIL